MALRTNAVQCPGRAKGAARTTLRWQNLAVGIGYLGARMMWDARSRGVHFDSVLTLGHQSLKLFPSEVDYLRDVYRRQFGTTTSPLDDHQWEDYIDAFLREYLGATSVTVLDASPYEGADTIHDMNNPVPPTWHSRYDAIVDGGTLEHIFNVPSAFTNIADMLKVGGTVFLNTPANNMMGHGFYQFSPELMFRIFSVENGFVIRSVLLYEANYPSVELNRKDTVYEVVDPDVVHQRAGLQNSKPVIMMVEATKTHHAPMFASMPQQSDYVQMWSDTGGPAGGAWHQRATRAVYSLPFTIRAPLLGYRQKLKFSLRNKTLYTREKWSTKPAK